MKSRKGAIPGSVLALALGKYVMSYLGLTKSDEELDKPFGLYEIWLRAITSQSSDTEINIQTAEFSLRRNPMELLEDWINDFQDFINLFGPVTETSTFQCAVVSSTSSRYVLILVLILDSNTTLDSNISITFGYIPIILSLYISFTIFLLCPSLSNSYMRFSLQLLVSLNWSSS